MAELDQTPTPFCTRCFANAHENGWCSSCGAQGTVVRMPAWATDDIRDNSKMRNETPVTKVQTHEHIALIRNLIGHAITELLRRAELHDQSKFSATEVDTFTKFTPKLKASTYGSEEYKGFLRDMKPALDHHYANNRHHPEFFENGINGMNLIDLLEMFIDWLASGKRHADGSIERSIAVNKDRFGMSDQLVEIFRNTGRDFTVSGMSNPYVSEVKR